MAYDIVVECEFEVEKEMDNLDSRSASESYSKTFNSIENCLVTVAVIEPASQ